MKGRVTKTKAGMRERLRGTRGKGREGGKVKARDRDTENVRHAHTWMEGMTGQS